MSLLLAQSGHHANFRECPLMTPSGHQRSRIAAVQTTLDPHFASRKSINPNLFFELLSLAEGLDDDRFGPRVVLVEYLSCARTISSYFASVVTGSFGTM